MPWDFSRLKKPAIHFTQDALELLDRLSVQGSLVIHISDGCCDGTVPNCYLQEEFFSDDNDVVVFDQNEIQVLIPLSTVHRFKDTLTIDVHDRAPAGFSLEVALDKRFYLK